MPENEFEKRVREELEQLRVKPSEEVWQQVRAGIRPEKRRKRWLIWVPFLLIGLGVGGYWLLNSDSFKVSTLVRNDEVVFPDKDNKKTDDGQNADKSLISNTEKDNIPSEKKSETYSDTVKSVTDADDDQGMSLETGRGEESKVDKVNKLDKVNKRAKGKKANKAKGKATILDDKPVVDSSEIDTSFAMITQSPNLDKVSSDSSAVVQPEPDKIVEKKSDSAAVAKTKPDTKSLIMPKWEYGITARAGYSNVRSDFFLLKANSARADYNSGGPVTPQAPGYVGDSIYKKSSFSWGVGFYVQRNLSERLAIKGGLMYTQYNFQIRVGNRIDSQIYVSNTLSSTFVDNFYQGGNSEYKNRFHYIEIPIAVSFQLNKGKNLPIHWDAGITPGFLVNSNFLYPDGNQGIYYQDNSILRKMQWSVQSGFTFGLFNQTKHSLQIGPQIQYMFTNLVKNAAASEQHLGYIGLRANLKLWNSKPVQRSVSK